MRLAASDLLQLSRCGTHPNDGAQTQAESAAIELRVLAEDHLLALETLEVLGDGRRGQPHPSSQIGETQAAVGLKPGEQTTVGVIEQSAIG